jgi:hypothetical protein
MCVPMLAAGAKRVDSDYRTVLLQSGRGSGGIAAALRPIEGAVRAPIVAPADAWFSSAAGVAGVVAETPGFD